MKQRRIKELTINHYEQGTVVSYTPSRTEEYAPVLAQAEAHQDLRFHATVNNVETPIVFPWESVIGVNATYETADVTAPTDAICNDAEEPSSPLVLNLHPRTGACYTVDGDNIAVVVSYTEEGSDFVATQNGSGELVDSLIESVTLNGESIDFYTEWEAGHFNATAELVVGQDGNVTMTAVATYYEYTSSPVVIVADHECTSPGPG